MDNPRSTPGPSRAPHLKRRPRGCCCRAPLLVLPLRIRREGIPAERCGADVVDATASNANAGRNLCNGWDAGPSARIRWRRQLSSKKGGESNGVETNRRRWIANRSEVRSESDHGKGRRQKKKNAVCDAGGRIERFTGELGQATRKMENVWGGGGSGVAVGSLGANKRLLASNFGSKSRQREGSVRGGAFAPPTSSNSSLLIRDRRALRRHSLLWLPLETRRPPRSSPFEEMMPNVKPAQPNTGWEWVSDVVSYLPHWFELSRPLYCFNTS